MALCLAINILPMAVLGAGDDATVNAVLLEIPAPPPVGPVNPDTADGTVSAILAAIAAIVSVAIISKKRRVSDDE